jgi:hypothetical protein
MVVKMVKIKNWKNYFIELVKDTVKVLKMDFSINLGTLKIYRYNIVLALLLPSFFFFQVLFSVYLLKEAGIFKSLGVSWDEVLLFVLVNFSSLFLWSLIYFKYSISYEIEIGIFKRYLLRPIDPMVFRTFFNDDSYFLTDGFYFLVFLLSLIFWFKLPLINLIKGFLTYFIYLFFLITFLSFINSLDLVYRKLTSLLGNAFAYNIEKLNNQYTPSYLKNSKLVYFFSLIFPSFVNFYLVVPAFLYGSINWILLILVILAFFLFFITTKLIWDKKLKDVEIYN